MLVGDLGKRGCCNAYGSIHAPHTVDARGGKEVVSLLNCHVASPSQLVGQMIALCVKHETSDTAERYAGGKLISSSGSQK